LVQELLEPRFVAQYIRVERPVWAFAQRWRYRAED